MDKKIAIFASGSGTNAENIVNKLGRTSFFSFPIIISNKNDAFIHKRAKKLNIPSTTFSNEEFKSGEKVLELLKQHKIDYIVLAGFLLKIPAILIENFPNRIINIHPALLPKYGGKGMYGENVHKAVCEAKETESGITIHYVNSNYDEGEIIFQAKCSISPSDTYKDVAEKIHLLEYEHFPKVIEAIWKK
jgi:phosphoribosylglycinamide formyltransferase-1